jgi:hypothetical protein
MTTETERRVRDEWAANLRRDNTDFGKEAIAQAVADERARIAGEVKDRVAQEDGHRSAAIAYDSDEDRRYAEGAAYAFNLALKIVEAKGHDT